MQQTSKIIIKKYPNRRLYNTATSSYIKLDNIALMVKQNKDFMVLDVKTQEDLTRSTLMQIILNYEIQGHHLIPENLIKMIIRFYDDPMNKMIQEYLMHVCNNFNSINPLNKTVDVSLDLIKEYEKVTKNSIDYFNELFINWPNKK